MKKENETLADEEIQLLDRVDNKEGESFVRVIPSVYAKEKIQNAQRRLKDNEIIKSYDVCINTARDKKERLMWKHRKEGWKLAMEELDKIFKEEFGEKLIK